MQLDDVPGCMGMYVRSDKVPPGVPQLNDTMPYTYGDELRSTLQVGLDIINSHLFSSAPAQLSRISIRRSWLQVCSPVCAPAVMSCCC